MVQNISRNNSKILVCMSGGVDSSVAAALLVKQGYDVTGAFMVNYDDPTAQKSCWQGDYQDALRVAAKLGIKLLRLDFQDEYKKSVLDYMYKEYEVGRTPNPDVLCNKYVKFGSWLDRAKELGFDFIATGHYARVTRPTAIPSQDPESTLSSRAKPRDLSLSFLRLSTGESMVRLMCAKDTNKDQTYFLHQLNQNQLQHVLFPIGDYTKEKVRKLAKKFDLPTAEKEESMGICFVGEVPMKDFLQKKIQVKKGSIIASPHARGGAMGGGSDAVLGTHDGLPFYTIGQRLAINSKPLFVVGKNFDKNEIVVGEENDPELFKIEAEVKEISWVSGKESNLPLKCLARLRHRQALQKCVLKKEDQKFIIKFSEPQRAVTPGQFAVFYVKKECLGGGEIV